MPLFDPKKSGKHSLRLTEQPYLCIMEQLFECMFDFAPNLVY